jgi:hypothetical protein
METPAQKEEFSEFAKKLPLIEKSFYKKFFRSGLNQEIALLASLN